MSAPPPVHATQVDIAIVGGGIMGAATALRLAEGGMRVSLYESGQLGMGASGVNAGTLSLQIKRTDLMPYALKGHALWKAAGDAVGYHEPGGLTLAFTAQEASILEERMLARRAAGAPIELITADQAYTIEPQLNRQVVAASYCVHDGYANSSKTGMYYRSQLHAAGVAVHERTGITRIERDGQGGYTLQSNHGRVHAARVLLATGAWTKTIAQELGYDLPIRARINTVSVTERMPQISRHVIGHATGLLTLKQSSNGTVLIGGGWQGRGTPDDGRGEVVTDTLITNLRLASYAIPALAQARLVRSWTGFEANTPDFYPLAGSLPGADNLFVLCCVRGGYTIGPYIGQLMGDHILGRALELPLFDPARFIQTGTS